MESRESQRDNRINQVIRDTKSPPSTSVMRAREELQGIEAERASNLERQKIMMQSQQSQMNTMREAAILGASGMVASSNPRQVALASQAAAMNPGTQAILQKYGVKPGKPQTTQSSRTQSNVSQGNIRTTTTNNTTTNTRNEIKIVQPQIPMRQQQIPMRDNAQSDMNKFKAWLDSSFAKQQNQFEIQQKEYRKREWNLARNSAKLFNKLADSTKSLGEKMDPKNMGSTLGGQLKTLLFLFLATTVTKWWRPLMKTIANVEAGVKSIFGIPVNADLQKGGAEGYNFVEKIKAFIGIPKGQGNGKSLLGGIREAIFDGVSRLTDAIKLFIDDRRLAIQKITMPDFKMPELDTGGLSGAISKAMGAVFRGIMAPATGYLGDILSALVGGSKGLVNKANFNLKAATKESWKHRSGGQYFTSNSTDMFGNLKSDSTWGVSKMLTNDLSDKSGTLHTGSIMTGLSMLRDTANREGSVMISPELLQRLGYSPREILALVKSGKAQVVPSKLVRVHKSEAEREDYSGGSLGSYVADETLNYATFGLIGGGLGKKAAKKWGTNTALGRFAKGNRLLRGIYSKAPGVGALLGLGGAGVSGVANYVSANAGNSDYVWKAVPLSDKRPGIKTNVLKLSKEGFTALSNSIGEGVEFSAKDPKFRAWVEARERANKVAMGFKGRFVQENDKQMRALDYGQQAYGEYNARMNEIKHRPGAFKTAMDNFSVGASSLFNRAGTFMDRVSSRFTGSIRPQHIPRGTARENAMRGMRYLMERYGLSKEAAAGIAGVIQRESNWNPAAENLSEKARGLKYGRGLCQWSNNWGVKAFPEWYQKVFGVRKYPNEVPLEHQLDYLMTGQAENGSIKKEFLQIIHKPGVTVEEAARAMYLGYENGGTKLASFERLAQVRAYGGASGVAKQYRDRISSSLGFYESMGGQDGAGLEKTKYGYSYGIDLAENDPGQAKYYGSMGAGGWQWSGNLKLVEAQDVNRTIGNVIDDNTMLGDWHVGRAVNYLTKNARDRGIGYCARFVRKAMEAGGMSTAGRPGSASDYVNYLPKIGWIRFSPAGEGQLQAGDISVTAAGYGHPHGHIAMWNTKQWVSDFRQRSVKVYKSGNPIFYFRYSGKGANMSGKLAPVDSFVDTATGAIGAAAAGAADYFYKKSDELSGSVGQSSLKYDKSSLTETQKATASWMEKAGAKSDGRGYYLQSGNVKAYLDINSGISKTGQISLENVSSVAYIGKGGAVRGFENNAGVANLLAGKMISDVIQAKVGGGRGGSAKYLGIDLGPGFRDYSGFSKKAMVYYENKAPRGIKYLLHSIDNVTAGIIEIDTGNVPLLDDSGSPIQDQFTGKPVYGTSGGPGWVPLLKKGAFKGRDLNPYLAGELRIGITPAAARIISAIQSYVRGEISESDITTMLGDSLPAGLDLNDKEFQSIREENKAVGAVMAREANGVSEKSIKESISGFKPGKFDKSKYSLRRLDDGKYEVYDKSGNLLGYSNDAQGNGFTARSVSSINSDSLYDPAALTRGQRMFDLSKGDFDVAGSEFDFGTFSHMEDLKFGDYRRYLAESSSGGTSKTIKDEFGNTWRIVLDENGTPKAIPTDVEKLGRSLTKSYTYAGKNLERILQEKGINIKKDLGDLSQDKIKEFLTEKGLNLKQLADIVGLSGGLDNVILDKQLRLSKYDRTGSLSYTDDDSYRRVMKEYGRTDEEIDEAIKRAKFLYASSNSWADKDSNERLAASSAVADYNANPQDRRGFEVRSGLLIKKDSYGRKYVVGMIGADGQAMEFGSDQRSGENRAKLQYAFHKNNEESIAALASKKAYFASRYGAIDQGDGQMSIERDGNRIDFNINQLQGTGPEDILRVAKLSKSEGDGRIFMTGQGRVKRDEVLQSLKTLSAGEANHDRYVKVYSEAIQGSLREANLDKANSENFYQSADGHLSTLEDLSGREVELLEILADHTAPETMKEVYDSKHDRNAPKTSTEQKAIDKANESYLDSPEAKKALFEEFHKQEMKKEHSSIMTKEGLMMNSLEKMAKANKTDVNSILGGMGYKSAEEFKSSQFFSDTMASTMKETEKINNATAKKNEETAEITNKTALDDKDRLVAQTDIQKLQKENATNEGAAVKLFQSNMEALNHIIDPVNNGFTKGSNSFKGGGSFFNNGNTYVGGSTVNVYQYGMTQSPTTPSGQQGGGGGRGPLKEGYSF